MVDKKKIKLFIVMTTVLLASIFTAVPGFAEGWSNNLSIYLIEVSGSGGVVYFNETIPSQSSCSLSSLNSVVAWDNTDASLAKNFLATMIAAKITSANVQVYIDPNTCLWGGWPKLLQVRLK